MTRGRRLRLFIVCLAAGLLAGAAGHGATGSPWWWLAVPLALLPGWWAAADPTRCADPARPGGGAGRRDRGR